LVVYKKLWYSDRCGAQAANVPPVTPMAAGLLQQTGALLSTLSSVNQGKM